VYICDECIKACVAVVEEHGGFPPSRAADQDRLTDALIAADPGKVHLLSASEIEPALKAGRDRAVREADRVKAFWA
jgi:hypothetical protein